MQNNIQLQAMLVGCVSSGKSSLLNAIVGGIVSPASKDRQTFNPIQYTLSSEGTYENTYKISQNINNMKNINAEAFNKPSIDETTISNVNKSFSELKLKSQLNYSNYRFCWIRRP
jgi:GTPase SAR1 family protein